MEEIVIRLNEHNITQIDGIITNGFRWLGWALIKILGTIVNGMETVVTKIYNLNGFFNSPEVNDLISRYKPLIWVILAISIAMLGMKIIFNKKQDKGQIPSNLIFSVMVIVLLPTLMIKFNDMTSLAVKSTNSGYTSSANELVKNSIYDLYYLDSINYKLDGATNKIPSDKIFRIDENELVDIKKVKNDKVMGNKVVVDKKGNLQVEKLEKGWLEIDEEFYRYSMDFISIIVTLGAMAITLLCVALKVARLLFELACDKLFATLFAFADIDDGKKVKEIIRHITTTFVIIFSTAMMTKLYVIFTAWLGSSMGNAGLDTKGLAKIVVLVGVSITVVQGPALIERILGMDAGVKNGWGVTMAGYGIAKGSGNVAKGLASGGIKLGKAGMLGMAGAAGAIAGGVGKNEGNKNSKEEEKEKDKNKENIGKPLSEEMKNSKGTSNGENNDLENSKDNRLENDNKSVNNNNEQLNEDKQNESGNLKNNDKTSNNPTLQEEMNNNSSNNKNSNSEESLSNIGGDKDNNASDIKDVLAKNESQKANKPMDNTLEEDMKNGELKNKNKNENPLQEEMKNDASGDKDSKGNSVRNIQEDLGKNEYQKVNKPIDNTLEQQMNNRELKNKNNNQNQLQEEIKNNASGDKNINGNNSKNVQGNIDREKPQNSNNPLQEEMKNNKTIPNEMNNRSKDMNSNLKDNNNNKPLNNNNRNNINSNGMNEKNTKNNSTGTNDNVNAPNEAKNGGEGTRKNTVGNMEDRDISQFIADGFKNSKMTNDMSRAYNLGKNTTSKWNVKNKKGGK